MIFRTRKHRAPRVVASAGTISNQDGLNVSLDFWGRNYKQLISVRMHRSEAVRLAEIILEANP